MRKYQKIKSRDKEPRDPRFPYAGVQISNGIFRPNISQQRFFNDIQASKEKIEKANKNRIIDLPPSQIMGI